MRLNAISAIATVTATAFFGMLLGASFGCAAGTLAPGLFDGAIPNKEVDPPGLAVVLGATAGVLCGGALGAFAIAIQALAALCRGLSCRRASSDEDAPRDDITAPPTTKEERKPLDARSAAR